MWTSKSQNWHVPKISCKVLYCKFVWMDLECLCGSWRRSLWKKTNSSSHKPAIFLSSNCTTSCLSIPLRASWISWIVSWGFVAARNTNKSSVGLVAEKVPQCSYASGGISNNSARSLQQGTRPCWYSVSRHFPRSLRMGGLLVIVSVRRESATKQFTSVDENKNLWSTHYVYTKNLKRNTETSFSLQACEQRYQRMRSLR